MSYTLYVLFHSMPIKVIKNFITPAHEKRLVRSIDRDKEWSFIKNKHRVKVYGYKYDEKTNSVIKVNNHPEYINTLIEKLRKYHILKYAPDQVLINEYFSTSSIPLHKDTVLDDAPIISITLLSQFMFHLSKSINDENKKSYNITPRSALILSGKSRHTFFHAVYSSEKSNIERRYTITFRSIHEVYSKLNKRSELGILVRSYIDPYMSSVPQFEYPTISELIKTIANVIFYYNEKNRLTRVYIYKKLLWNSNVLKRYDKIINPVLVDLYRIKTVLFRYDDHTNLKTLYTNLNTKFPSIDIKKYRRCINSYFKTKGSMLRLQKVGRERFDVIGKINNHKSKLIALGGVIPRSTTNTVRFNNSSKHAVKEYILNTLPNDEKNKRIKNAYIKQKCKCIIDDVVLYSMFIDENRPIADRDIMFVVNTLHNYTIPIKNERTEIDYFTRESIIKYNSDRVKFSTSAIKTLEYVLHYIYNTFEENENNKLTIEQNEDIEESILKTAKKLLGHRTGSNSPLSEEIKYASLFSVPIKYRNFVHSYFNELEEEFLNRIKTSSIKRVMNTMLKRNNIIIDQINAKSKIMKDMHTKTIDILALFNFILSVYFIRNISKYKTPITHSLK